MDPISRAPSPVHAVAIIGTGFGGIGMAIRLRMAGIDDFILLERAAGIGGTWRENTYPGAACDVPSPLYSFSFEQDFAWSRLYAHQPDILRYQRHCVDKYELHDRIQFNSEVTLASYDEAAGLWNLAIAGGGPVRARVLITATGQLNRPARPQIPGLDAFSGPVFHSAEWDHRVALAGRRVGVVGTGASAVQLLPRVAAQAARVVLFQRSPPYILPKLDLRIPALVQGAYRHLPALRWLTRGLIYGVHESFGVAILKFHPGARLLRALCLAHMRHRVRDPSLQQRLTPDYAFGCKRILVDNAFYRAVTRPEVSVVTDGIQRVSGDAVVTTDGTRHELDVVILATGFDAQGFVAPMEIMGRGGATLRGTWGGTAEAYRGTTVAGFPNLFLLYGPNTNLGHSSIIYMLESQFEYILGALRRLQAAPGTAFDVRAEAQRRYNAQLQRELEATVWHDGCHSWYADTSGRITSNWSGLTFTFRNQLRRFDAENYVVLPVADHSMPGPASARAAAAPAVDPSWQASTARAVVRTVLKPALHPRIPLSFQRLWIALAARTLLPARDATCRADVLDGVPCERIDAASEAPGKALLYLHGGAYITCSPRVHRSITSRLCARTGAQTWVPDYRLAPEHRFPAALDDAARCYHALLRQVGSSTDIVLAGDSAGGGLALALLARLRDEGAPLPAGTLLISPWSDLSCSNLAFVRGDAMLDRAWLLQGAASYLGGAPATTALASPRHANLRGLPPVMVQSAGSEIIRNDVRGIVAALRDAGVAVEHDECPGLWHDFQLYGGLVPEATEALYRLSDRGRTWLGLPPVAPGADPRPAAVTG